MTFDLKESEASHYLHGDAPDEQARLSLLNELLNAGSLREMKLGDEKRILDVGSGLGQLTRAMARSSGPNAYVLGIERSSMQIDEARHQAGLCGESSLVEFRQGDASHLPLEEGEWGTFDLAHTRFLLEHLPRPLDVVAGMVRALRPGGRIILEDDDHEILRLWPEPEGFAELWQAYMRSYEYLGNDPVIGRKLAALLKRAGAEPVRNTLVFFGSCAGERHFHHYMDNLTGVIAGSRETVTAAGLMAADRFDAAIAVLIEWGRREDAALWYAIPLVEGRKP